MTTSLTRSSGRLSGRHECNLHQGMKLYLYFCLADLYPNVWLFLRHFSPMWTVCFRVVIFAFWRDGNSSISLPALSLSSLFSPAFHPCLPPSPVVKSRKTYRNNSIEYQLTDTKCPFLYFHTIVNPCMSLSNQRIVSPEAILGFLAWLAENT